MSTVVTRIAKISSILITLTFILISQAAFAGEKHSSKGHGKNKNVGVGNASDGISARIVTAKDIFYTGDPMAISLRFNRGADLVSSGEVDAYIVIFSPIADSTDDSTDTTTDTGTDTSTDTGTDSTSGTTDASDTTATDTAAAVGALTDAIVLPVSNEASSDEHKLFEVEAVDVSALPAGTYQLGLILTNPGGDPLVINDWFKGLLGLVDIVGLTVSDEALPFDEDGDGEVDDDADGDGFSDDTDDSDDHHSSDKSSKSAKANSGT